MEIIVRGLSGIEWNIATNADATVRDLEQLVESAAGVPSSSMQLVFEGNILKRDLTTTLSSHGLKDGSELILITVDPQRLRNIKDLLRSTGSTKAIKTGLKHFTEFFGKSSSVRQTQHTAACCELYMLDILPLLQHPDYTVRIATVRALSTCGQVDPSLVCLKDENWEVRKSVLDAIYAHVVGRSDIDVDVQQVLVTYFEQVEPCLKDDHKTVRRIAADIVGGLRPYVTKSRGDGLEQ